MNITKTTLILSAIIMTSMNIINGMEKPYTLTIENKTRTRFYLNVDKITKNKTPNTLSIKGNTTQKFTLSEQEKVTQHISHPMMHPNPIIELTINRNNTHFIIKEEKAEMTLYEKTLTASGNDMLQTIAKFYIIMNAD